MRLHYFFFSLMALVVLGSVLIAEDQKMARPYEDEDGVSYEDVYLGEDMALPDKYYSGFKVER